MSMRPRQDRGAEGAGSPRARQEPQEGDATRIDVLLIDDNADFPILIRRALETRDPRYRVTSVATPEEGEALLDEQSFDLVLLDYKFPRGVNGLQVIRKLKNKATYVPTVMVTAFGDEGLAIQAMREGALDFVPKASDFIQALPDVVGRAIERGRIIRERIATQRALEQRNRELQALSDITSAINANVGLDEILAAAMGHLSEIFDAERHAVHLVESSPRRLVRVAGTGEDVVPLGGEPSRMAWAVSDGTVQVDRDDRGAAVLIIPVVAGSQSIGAVTLWLERDHEVLPAEQSLAASIGKQLGVALERARLHGALDKTRSYLSDLVDNAADEVVTLDEDGHIRTWNNGAESIYGWSSEEVVGHDWSMLWSADRGPEADGLARAVIETGATIKNHETVRRTRDGMPVEVLLTLTPLRGADGGPGGVSCLGKNVTTIKQLQTQLVQSEKMAVVGQLISGVAHELNNPLTSVLGYAQLMAEVDVGAKRDTYLEKITAEAGRCQRIVHNLLSFARKHEPRATRVDVNQLLHETLELRAYDLRVTNVDIDVELADDLPTTLADGHQLQQVFINIIANAQQAMQSRGRGRLVLRTTHEDPGAQHASILVSFADDGPGIPETLRKKIFDPFFTTKPAGEGTGLGLSLSYGIVKQHGGDITAGSSSEGGALFEIRLPVLPELTRSADALARMPASRAASEVGVGATSADGDASSLAGAAGRRRILVVDDQAPVREMVSDALAPQGYDVVLAGDGREALDLIAGGSSFDLVIVDLRMPEFGGDRLWRQVRRFAPELADRMVFASGDLSGDALSFLGGARNRSISKPFGAEDVRSTVSAFFQEQS
jgi:two-component system NtrC family sensor kinase